MLRYAPKPHLTTSRLSELTIEWNNLTDAERDNSEEGQRLQAQTRAVSDELKKQEGKIGDNRRNVGGYAQAYKQSFGALVAELVKVTAAQKGVDAASEQGQRLQQQRIGFLTAAQKAAALSGISDFTQAQATIEQYSQALQPAAENLVRLQQEQVQAAQGAGESSQQYQQLGFQVAGAQKTLDDLVSAQQAAADAARNGGAAAQGQAAEVEVAVNSLAGLRDQLVRLQNLRETLDPTTKEAQELNTTILKLQTNIAIGSGKVDEFGEKVKTNIKKENFDTVSDAIQGLTGVMSAATIVFGDNSDAAKVQAKTLQLMALAQDARTIAIGLGSAREAVAIVLSKARNLLLKEEAELTAAAAVSTETHAAVAGADAAAVEAQAAAAALNAEGQAASAAATVTSTAATEAQVVVTEGATLAQKALNLAMKLNPIGLVIIAITALVGAFLAYSNASEKTQQRVRSITEAILRFGTPVGLLITLIQKLAEKFAPLREALDFVEKGFNAIAKVVVKDAQALGEYLGILDTAAEKAAKFATQQQELAQATIAQIEAEAKALELAGGREEDVRAKRRQGLVEDLRTRQDAAIRQNAFEQEQHAKQLARIEAQLKAGQTLDDKDKELYEKRRERSQQVQEAELAIRAFDNESVEKRRVIRQQEAQDVETNAARASQNLQRRIEQQQAAEQAAAQRRLGYIDLQLSAVQKGTVQELELQQKKVQAQASLEISQAQATLAAQQRLRAQYLPTQLAALNREREQALQQFGLTEQQKSEVAADYTQKRIDLEQRYSLVAAKQAVAQIPLIRAQANTAELKLRVDFERQLGAVVLASQAEVNRARLTLAKEGSLEQHELSLTLIRQEEELTIAGLDKQAMTTLEYEAKVTAIRADGVAKRKALAEQESQRVQSLLQDDQRAAELNEQALLQGHSEARQTEIRASQQFHSQLVQAEVANYAAQVLATKEGTEARENVEKQHALNLQAIEQQTSQAQVQTVAAKFQRIADMTSQALSAISTIQDAATQDQLNRIKTEENASTTSAARKAVLAKQEERISQQQHERQKKFAIAQAIIDGGSAVMRILADTPKVDFGVATAVEIALAALTTAAQIRTISSQKFAVGGVV